MSVLLAQRETCAVSGPQTRTCQEAKSKQGETQRRLPITSHQGSAISTPGVWVWGRYLLFWPDSFSLVSSKILGVDNAPFTNFAVLLVGLQYTFLSSGVRF